MNNNDKIYTLKEMQEYLQIGQNTALKLVNNGKIKARKIGKVWRIKKSEIDKYMNEHDN